MPAENYLCAEKLLIIGIHTACRPRSIMRLVSCSAVPQVQNVGRTTFNPREDFRPEDPRGVRVGQQHPSSQHGLDPVHPHPKGMVDPKHINTKFSYQNKAIQIEYGEICVIFIVSFATLHVCPQTCNALTSPHTQ